MDKEYRNLLRHAETENDFIKVERIQIRKGLRTQTILINNCKKEESCGTKTVIGTRTNTETETEAGIIIRTEPGTETRTRTRIGTRTDTRIKTWTGIMTTTRTRIY